MSGVFLESAETLKTMESEVTAGAGGVVERVLGVAAGIQCTQTSRIQNMTSIENYLTLPRITKVLVMLLVAVSLSACADRDDAYEMDGDTLGMAPSDTSGLMTEGMPMEMEGDTVEVTLTEHAIQMPSSIPSGSTTFKVTNEGTEEHSFEIEGQGVEEALTANLQPGDSTTLTADLQAGTYTAYCPVGNHREMGMQTQVNVQESGTTARAY